MTDVVRAFPLAIVASTPIATPVSVSCMLEVCTVTKILLTWAPGAAGLVGVRVEHGGSQVYPKDKNTWFLFDDYTLEIDPTDQSNSGQWVVTGYNLDIYPHTIQSYFFYDYVDLNKSKSSPGLVSLLG